MKATVTVTSVTQTANKELGTAEKHLHYLIIQTSKGKEVINVGEKTVKKVKALDDGTK